MVEAGINGGRMELLPPGEALSYRLESAAPSPIPSPPKQMTIIFPSYFTYFSQIIRSLWYRTNLTPLGILGILILKSLEA